MNLISAFEIFFPNSRENHEISQLDKWRAITFHRKYTSLLTSIDCIFINEDDISGPLKIKRTNCDSFLNWTNE